VEVKPAKWYHHLLVIGLVALPLVQAGAYDYFQSAKAVFVPLAIFLSFALPMVMLSPRAINREPLDARKSLGFLVMLAGGTAISFLLPLTGLVVIMRGLLVDCLGLAATTLIARMYHQRKYNVRDEFQGRLT